MTSNKDQDSYQQPNYADHLKRVRRVKRTLDVNFTPNPPSKEREHVSHESLKDQAISRKSRRPAEDYEIGKGLFSSEEAGSPTPSRAETPPASPVEQSEPAKSTALSAKPSENTASTKPGEQLTPNPPIESSSKGSLDAADKNRIPVVKDDFDDSAGGDEQPRKRGSMQFVAKTLLDHNSILKAQALRQKARVEKELSIRQQVPVKVIEPIKAQKEVRSCPFSWTDDSSTERFKHCSKCQRAIYNLNGMEFSEVESLIFTRENIKKIVLFKRPDGKFMTSDCPVEQKRKQQIVGVVALCICLIACIAGVLIMMPPAPSPTVDHSWGEPAPKTVSPGSEFTGSKSTASQSAGSKSSSGTKSSGTMRHYEAGDPLPTEPASGSNTNSQVQKPINPSEEKGDFWEFSGQ